MVWPSAESMRIDRTNASVAPVLDGCQVAPPSTLFWIPAICVPMYMIKGFVGSVAKTYGFVDDEPLVTLNVAPSSVERHAALPPREVPTKSRPLARLSG